MGGGPERPGGLPLKVAERICSGWEGWTAVEVGWISGRVSGEGLGDWEGFWGNLKTKINRVKSGLYNFNSSEKRVKTPAF